MAPVIRGAMREDGPALMGIYRRAALSVQVDRPALLASPSSLTWAWPVRAARVRVIEGEGRLIASSDPAASTGTYSRGDRVFHQKFGYGKVTLVEGAKLTVYFDKAGEKRVLEGFVEKA